MTMTMYVTYSGDANTRFDREHWISVHLPLVRECWGPYGLERVGGFFPEGDGGGLIAIAPCVFRDEEAMQAALGSTATARVMDAVKKVTNVEPERSVGQPL